MKFLVLAFAMLVTAPLAQATERYETVCRKHDCFRYGWVTKGIDYKLETKCKGNDCASNGWSSSTPDHSESYDVTCKPGGCFTEGWHSVQKYEGETFEDEVSCRFGGCLSTGWFVRTGYDLSGGDVSCSLGDCSTYGGFAYWRGRVSRTTCYDGDCYHKGWSLSIY